MLPLFLALLSEIPPQTANDIARSDAPHAFHSLHLEMPYTPSIARIDGDDRLVYELHVTNFSARPLKLSRIEIRTEADGTSIAELDPAAAMRRLGPTEGAPGLLAPGQRGIFYLSFRWPRPAPASLVHRIALVSLAAHDTGRRVMIEGGQFTPYRAFTAALGAPLRGGPWTAVWLPDIDNGHRRFLYAVRGSVRVPGRHAIDWMPAHGFVPATAGTATSPDGSGADVLAVADAEIVAVKDGRVDPARPDVEDETGAMIVLKLPDGRHAFYQHLAPDVAATPGTRVRKGQVIGRVGATGHVTRPHLHFHVADGIAPLDSEGLPYRFAAGHIVGRYAAPTDFDNGSAWEISPSRAIDGMPAAFSVIRFDE
ncbi:MAG: M23 family metallopeptidase [Sphingopyxis sp.]|uniref:M23 family metallopeptidase n=1 Tax=Sphingopyxis sp. TaxID=1908224 RepID=UPI002AB9F0AC|nr:M23 family metallopeptidase [Sphingopyxis sp.]MDZ3831563.1 M23 family metallopeptidase [Sphingopyxis sp.]